MMSPKNPFPGMNPFLEGRWRPVHSKLLSLIDDEICGRLPADLVSRPEERLVIDELDPPKGYIPDVMISESWKYGHPPKWMPENDPQGLVKIAEPDIVMVDQEVERWIEISTADGKLITAIELLSPANKGAAAAAYRLKQRNYLESTASLVEIDLLRGGSCVLPVPAKYMEQRHPKGATHYHICVSRAWKQGTREVYSWPLRERIPAFRIPLRPTDKDIVLDLQPLIDRCYEVGRYYMGRFDQDPEPPFPPEEAAWVDERLKAAGLRA